MSISADATAIYAVPLDVTNLGDCSFYHTMEIPGHALVQGEWDLRDDVQSYLGNVEFEGKRVLELGTADGYLTFEIEKRGAEVVSYDLSVDHRPDSVPFARAQSRAPQATSSSTPHSTASRHPDSENEFTEMIRRLNNAYWLCHRAYGSRARLVHGDVYSVPADIGPVDISVFGALLLHTRDPFQALTAGTALTRETVVVTEGLGLLRLPAPLRWARRALPPQMRRPVMRFIPDARKAAGPHGWWRLTPEIVQAFLAVLGFERSQVIIHTQLYNGRRRRLFTVVAHRTAGQVLRAST